MTKEADKYQIARAVRPLREFKSMICLIEVRAAEVDADFWKSEDDSDKKAAYVTLHYGA